MTVDNVTGSGHLPSGLMNGTEQWSSLDTRHCYVEGRVFDCVRISVLLLLGICTGLICLLRVMQYHCYRARNYHLHLVYYIALLICLLSIIHWGYLWTPILDLVNTYLLVIQMLVIAWFFCSWAFRILQKEKLFTYGIVPILVCVGVYFSGCLVWASIKTSSASQECAEPQWLLYSSSLFVLVQFFLVCVIYITKKLNDVRTMKTNRCSQKAQLWGLAVTYEVVSMASLGYDIYLLRTKSVDQQCGTKFDSDARGVGVAIMFVLHKIIKYLIPQLVISAVFAPIKARPIKFQHEMGETDTISWADKPDYKSTFDGVNPNSSMLPQQINCSTTPILPRSISNSSGHTSPFILPSQARKTSNNATSTPNKTKPLPPLRS